MSLPRVNVNVQEDVKNAYGTSIPFIPAVIMKTKAGPINTIELIRSEDEFISKFGNSDETVPSALAVQTYLRTYSYIYVTRVASTNAKKGNGTAEFASDDGNVSIFTVQTDTATDIFNGKAVKLVYDADNKKVYLQTYTGTKNIISIKEDLDMASAEDVKPEVFYAKINTLIKSLNSANLGFTITPAVQISSGTVPTDPVPTAEQLTEGIEAVITEGDSGNDSTIENSAVISAVDNYVTPELSIDVMLVPEFDAAEVQNHITDLAYTHNFMNIHSVNANSKDELTTKIENYDTGKQGSLALYYPDVNYNFNGRTVRVPASVAVLHTYAKNDVSSKWGAPAGVIRGTLNLAQSVVTNLSQDEASLLYDGTVPVNPIMYISGKGIVVWGNKTTDTVTPFMDRINISRLVKYVTKEIYNISWNYLFEPITTGLYTDWSLRTETFLDGIVEGDGIDAYEVQMDDTINSDEDKANNILNGIVRIKPTRVAEFINIDFVITDNIETIVSVNGYEASRTVGYEA